MADEKPPARPPAKAALFVAGAVTVCFVLWLCWLVTRLVATGIPAAARGDLIATLVLAAAGVVASMSVSAQMVKDSPFDFIKSIVNTVRTTLLRR